MPETKAVINTVLDDREGFHDMFEDSWTQKQDAMHREFFDTWIQWTSDSIHFDTAQFPHAYPTGGASESLREIIQQYGNDARAGNFEPVIHVFESEYEGYQAYADNAHVKVVTHKRENWREAVETLGKNDLFFLSQPSAIDGNVWEDYDIFMRMLDDKRPDAKVILDLTYVGGVKPALDIKADYPNISHVVFSLSKPFGVYYHRIGGVFSREEMGGLWGNMWFKNVGSLRFGTELMNAYKAGELPRKYAHVQEEAAARISKVLGVDLQVSDVFLVATAKMPDNPTEEQEYFRRGDLIRVCLTPMMDKILKQERTGP
ncbi:MAG: hypothetical protein GC136_09345 [Alphaproteobacteria bacterium]|nr:hypothetical protein [Alphaproteobacteria bacterium]